MIKKSVLFFLLIILLLISCNQIKTSTELALPSPDAQNHLYFNLNNGEPWYLFYRKSEIIVDWSLLGVVLDDQTNFTEDLSYIKSESRSVTTGDTLILKDESFMVSPYNEMIVFLNKVENPEHHFKIIFRAYNNGFAFGYDFEKKDNDGMINIASEETEFNLYDKSTKWEAKTDGQNDAELHGSPKPEQFTIPLELVSQSGFSVTIIASKDNSFPGMTLVKQNPLKSGYKCQISFLPEVQNVIRPGIGTSYRVILVAQDNSINQDIK
jgi:hypothetical protein